MTKLLGEKEYTMVGKNQYENVPSWQQNMIFQSTLVWRDLAAWFRLYLVSAYTNLGDKEIIYNMISKIPVDFGNSIKLIFGEEIAGQYIDLLNLQILLTRNLIDAQIKGDTQGVSNYTKEVYEVADKRAALLAKINPYWNENEFKSLMYTYISLIIEETIALLTKDYNRSISAYNQLIAHSTLIGEYYSQGMYNYILSNSNNKSTS